MTKLFTRSQLFANRIIPSQISKLYWMPRAKLFPRRLLTKSSKPKDSLRCRRELAKSGLRFVCLRNLKPPAGSDGNPADEEFTTEMGACPLVFLPLLEELGIIPAIAASGFPQTKTLSDIQSVLSFPALKLTGSRRWSHDTKWNTDRAPGFFAGLNVLPKSTALSTYSYRITRPAIRNFLVQLSRIFIKNEETEDEFNLDFKAIPHWGDESVLEKNRSGTRSKPIKSLLALIVQSPSSGYLSYTDAEIKRSEQSKAVFEFIDFWKHGRGTAPKFLIFDSKFTTYESLDKLNRSKDRIKFLTLRRRGKRLVSQAEKLPEDQWQKIKIERSGGKEQSVRINDGMCKLKGYEGGVRQIILTDHGREKPTFLITDDFNADAKEIVRKYARRNLVEQEISEQIIFFSLNNPSSSIVVKVDFDLAISLLAHNLYRILSANLSGFENCTAMTINRKFLENGAVIEVKGNDVLVSLKKKTHLPILFQLPWMTKTVGLSWMGVNIQFMIGTTS